MSQRTARHQAKIQNGLCSAISKKELFSKNTISKCTNSDNSISYTLNTFIKNKIIERLTQLLLSMGYNIDDIEWVGEVRTGLTDGTIIKFGYRNCCTSDEDF